MFMSYLGTKIKSLDLKLWFTKHGGKQACFSTEISNLDLLAIQTLYPLLPNILK